MAQLTKMCHNSQIMPKKIPQDEFDAILKAITRFPDGASVGDLSEALEKKLPRRTLQRHLARLVEQERLAIEGRGRGSRYRFSKITGESHAAIPGFEIKARGEVYIPISPEGKSIKEAVRLPIQDRQPVGYSRTFLDTYRPNESCYLPEETRRHLIKLGRSTENKPPAGTYVQRIFNRLLIDLSWNSSRLEGNTYSLLETERLLELGESAEGKNAIEAQMILNHKAAIELLVEQAAEIGFNRYTILNLHALLSDNLLGDPQACGRLRNKPVGIDGTVYHPLEVPQLVDECFQQICDTATAIQDPFEQALFAMVHLPYLQPFEDVNKRVSRLSANIPLIRQDLCPLSFVDVPSRAYIDGILGVYELNRVELLRDVFVWAYERSCARYSAVRQSLGEPDPFRLRYRKRIYESVATVVQGQMTKREAIRWINRESEKRISVEDRARFIEVVETELSSLHEGNIARYRLRPSEFEVWYKNWK